MSATILTTSQIIEYIQRFIKSKNPLLDLQPGTDLYDLILHGNSQSASRIFEELQIVENNQSIFTTYGKDLDSISKNYNLTRKRAIFATGFVTFFTTNFTSDIVIPDRTIVSTKGSTTLAGVTYTTVGDYIMLFSQKSIYFSPLTGRYELTIPIKCSVAGSIGNTDDGTMSVVQSNVNQIQGCTNYNSITGGLDEEPDEELQQRCALSWVTSSVGTRDGYRKLFLDQDIVNDALAIGPFDNESVREGVDVYLITNSPLALVSPQAIVYNNDEYTILSNQPTVEIVSIIDTTASNWNMLENVSYTFNKQVTSSISNSSEIGSGASRIEWVDPWNGEASSSSAGGDTLTYTVSGGAVSITGTDAYVNTRVTFTAGSINNVNQTRTVTGFSYNNQTNTSTFTFSPPFSGAITVGDPFTLNPRPNIGDTVNIDYLYNSDIQTLQDFVDQSTLNVVGANIMVKNGLRSNLTLGMNVKLFSGYDFSIVETKISNAINQYISALKFGNDIQLSDIIVVAQTGRGTDYTIFEVDYVDIDTSNDVSFIEYWDGTSEGFSTEDIIELENKEYSVLENLTINQI